MLHIDAEVDVDLVEDPVADRTAQVEEAGGRNSAAVDEVGMVADVEHTDILKGEDLRMEPEGQEGNRESLVAEEDNILPEDLAAEGRSPAVAGRENVLGKVDIREADGANLLPVSWNSA
jgi:hypothetical protein